MRAGTYGVGEAVDGGRASEVVALGVADAESAEDLEFVFVFDSFGDDLRAGVGCERHEGGGEGTAHRV